MNESTLEITNGFALLKTHLQLLVRLLLTTDPRHL